MIAIVTGASSGMGKEFVLALDKQRLYDEIWVVARRKEQLAALQTQTHAKIVALSLDLSDEKSFDVVAEKLAAEKPSVKTLVNAAGFGKFQYFEKTPLHELTSMIDVNCKALTAMTHVVLPYMTEGSEIYQMGSLSCFQPVPAMLTYGATKAFVLSFSRALGMELAPRKIKVMAVCPGWIKTEFFDHAIEDNTISYFNRYYMPDAVIAQALVDMAKGKTISTLGASERTQTRLVKLLPVNTVMKVWCKQQHICGYKK